MKNNKEIKEWLLANCVNYDGDLDLRELDFSDFDGDILISYLIVKKDLHQDSQEVGGDLLQDSQKVKGYAYIGSNEFAGIKEWDREAKEWKITKEKNGK